jgi:hypothetical protein
MIKRSPRPETHYLIVSNQVVRDPSLSFKARGLLAYLLSMPDNWKVSASAIARASDRDGRESILTGLKELEGAGYLRRWRHQDDAGNMVNESVVFDTPAPVQIHVGNPVGKGLSYPLPKSDFPTTENPTTKERTTKNKPPTKSVLNSTNREPRICAQCRGAGWIPDNNNNLTPCNCDAGITHG